MLQRKFLSGVEILSVDINKIKKDLKNITLKIKRNHPEVVKIILFGSFAENNYTPYSDIDIAIIVEKTSKNFVLRQDDFIDYFKNLNFDVNILVYTQNEIEKLKKENNKFVKEILQGKEL
jgi:predicted nucleotidyltransferase